MIYTNWVNGLRKDKFNEESTINIFGARSNYDDFAICCWCVFQLKSFFLLFVLSPIVWLLCIVLFNAIPCFMFLSFSACLEAS